ncbi:hypothetical protein [Desulfatibacillum aliphaticivorans]|uniref:hypothetical protein n=1 Tax=Desulfatibacillum aliphaticivorans TaxID=218208 RepID=UPI0005C1315B|nr:hypothetical protein [Desulfatibacillum aliphaticivorans]
MKLLELDPVGGMPEIMADVIAKNCTNIPKVGRFMAISVQWLTATFIQTTFGEWLSKATKKDFPIGYFLVIENYDGVKHIHLWLS